MSLDTQSYTKGTLQIFTVGVMGSLQGFPVVGKPCNIYRLRGNPTIIMGFPPYL